MESEIERDLYMFALKYKKSIFAEIWPDRVDYVGGFSAGAGVSIVDGVDKAKKFKTKNAANKFVSTYSGAGYGLESDMVEIVEFV